MIDWSKVRHSLTRVIFSTGMDFQIWKTKFEFLGQKSMSNQQNSLFFYQKKWFILKHNLAESEQKNVFLSLPELKKHQKISEFWSENLSLGWVTAQGQRSRWFSQILPRNRRRSFSLPEDTSLESQVSSKALQKMFSPQNKF